MHWGSFREAFAVDHERVRYCEKKVLDNLVSCLLLEICMCIQSVDLDRLINVDVNVLKSQNVVQLNETIIEICAVGGGSFCNIGV